MFFPACSCVMSHISLVHDIFIGAPGYIFTAGVPCLVSVIKPLPLHLLQLFCSALLAVNTATELPLSLPVLSLLRQSTSKFTHQAVRLQELMGEKPEVPDCVYDCCCMGLFESTHSRSYFKAELVSVFFGATNWESSALGDTNEGQRLWNFLSANWIKHQNEVPVERAHIPLNALNAPGFMG